MLTRPNPETIGGRRFIGLDLEFDPTTRSLVCISFAERVRYGGNRGAYNVWVRSGVTDREGLLAELLGYLRDPSVCLVMMAGALDSVVLCRWGGDIVRAALVAKMKARGIADVFLREWLLWVAFPYARNLWQCGTSWDYVDPGSEERHGAGDAKRPKMSLAAIVERWTGRRIEWSKHGDASVRLAYGRVAHLPIEAWPKRYVDYACDDALDHLRCWEHQAVGKSLNKAVDNEALSGYYRVWPRIRAAVPGQGNNGLLPGEAKAVMDALPMAWLCEPANGGLYVDPAYTDNLIERYRSVAEAMEPLCGSLLKFVDARGQGELFPDLLTSAALIKKTKEVKTHKPALRRAAHALYDCMPIRWTPPATKKGWQVCGRFPNMWRDWLYGDKDPRNALAGFSLSGVPGVTYEKVDHRKYASLSGKVISECLLETLASETSDPAIVRALAWMLAPANPGHALHQISTGKWTAEKIVADGMAITDLSKRKLWAWVVRQTCLMTVANSLAPLAKLCGDLAPGGIDLRAPAVNSDGSPAPGEGRKFRTAVTPASATALITGRYSLGGAIRQNTNKAGGVREALVPEPGWVVFLADYSTIELYGFAKAIEFAYAQKRGLKNYVSSLSRVLMAGKDPHIILALDLIAHANPRMREILEECATRYPQAPAANGGVEDPMWRLHDVAVLLRKQAKKWHATPEQPDPAPDILVGQLLDELRDQAKRLNFGLGGLMQPAKFVETQRKAGDYSWTIASATEAWTIWRKRWHEVADFEIWCNEIVKRGGDHGGIYLHPHCWRVRGGLSLTQAANTTFQTPVAEMFKAAVFQAWEETFDPKSPLYGCKLVLVVHDEIVCVGPKARAPAALARLQAIMKHHGIVYLPGLPVGTSGAILERFAKAA